MRVSWTTGGLGGGCGLVSGVREGKSWFEFEG